MDRVKVRAGQYHILNEVVRAFEYYNSFEEFKKEAVGLFVKGAMLKMGVLMWCQIFGTDKEKTHWRNNFNKEERESLITACGIKNWAEYRGKMVKVRNELVSHFDIDISEHYIPDLTDAINISLKIRDLLVKDTGLRNYEIMPGYNKPIIDNNLYTRAIRNEKKRISKLFKG